ncbi:MAG: hypothetical protein WC777_05995 [Candidatus Gracilibacteria bacterium]
MKILNVYFKDEGGPKFGSKIAYEKNFDPHVDDKVSTPSARVINKAHSSYIVGVGLPAARRETLADWFSELFLSMKEMQLDPKGNFPLMAKATILTLEDLSTRRVVVKAIIDRLFLGQTVEQRAGCPEDVWSAMLKARSSSQLKAPVLGENSLIDFVRLQMVHPDLDQRPLLKKGLQSHARKAALQSGLKPEDASTRLVIERLLGKNFLEDLTKKTEKLAWIVPQLSHRFATWYRFWINEDHIKETEDILNAKVEPVVEQFYEGFKIATFFRHLGEKLAKGAAENPEFTEQALLYLALARGISEELTRQASLIEVSLDMKTLGDGFDLSAVMNGVAALEFLRSDPAASAVVGIIQDVLHKVQASSELARLES